MPKGQKEPASVTLLNHTNRNVISHPNSVHRENSLLNSRKASTLNMDNLKELEPKLLKFTTIRTKL